jgi:phage tail-like protein
MPIKSHLFTPAIWFELKITPAEEPTGYYTEVSGLSSEIETLSYNEGGRNDAVHKLPTRMKHPNLVLKRGLTLKSDLEKWIEESFNGPARREITLTMFNEQLERIRSWNFKGAYPVKWTGPQFNAQQNTLATESIEIAHDGIWVA